MIFWSVSIVLLFPITFSLIYISNIIDQFLKIFVCVYIYIVGRKFANSSEGVGSTPGRVIQKTLKMVLDTSLLNTQQYKVRIKGELEQSMERSSAFPYTSVL